MEPTGELEARETQIQFEEGRELIDELGVRETQMCSEKDMVPTGEHVGRLGHLRLVKENECCCKADFGSTFERRIGGSGVLFQPSLLTADRLLGGLMVLFACLVMLLSSKEPWEVCLNSKNRSPLSSLPHLCRANDQACVLMRMAQNLFEVDLRRRLMLGRLGLICSCVNCDCEKEVELAKGRTLLERRIT